jgi:hypothetical protein
MLVGPVGENLSAVGAPARRSPTPFRPLDQTNSASMVGEELRRLLTWQERHRRLLARLLIAFSLTLVVDLVGALLIWNWEGGLKGGDIHGFGDSLFFATVQLLTVSSQIKNPLTGIGKIVDVALELWAIGVVTALAGSFSSFFSSGDS